MLEESILITSVQRSTVEVQKDIDIKTDSYVFARINPIDGRSASVLLTLSNTVT